jgi:transposase
MFFPEDRVRVWLYARPTDMRKQFDGLAALARNQLNEDPMSGHVFVFINRRRTYMKVLYFDRGGYCLWCKRLEQGQFNYNSQRGDKQALSWTELKLLLDGVKVQKSRQFKRYQHVASTTPRYNTAHG